LSLHAKSPRGRFFEEFHSRPAGPATPGELPALLNTVRAHGLRVSTARRRVLVALLAAEHPLSAEQIAGGSDVASVYRNLETLESIGLVQHVHPGHGPGRYVLGGHGGWASCQACGAAMRLAPAAHARIRAAVREACGFDARFDHFPVVGLCPGCSRDPQEGTPSWLEPVAS
jgi:Fur family ferric uptake transcriptional regulator